MASRALAATTVRKAGTTAQGPIAMDQRVLSLAETTVPRVAAAMVNLAATMARPELVASDPRRAAAMANLVLEVD